jgi:transposase
MPWNEADWGKYEVIRARCASDMSEAELALIAPLMPPSKRRGRKPTDARIILNALFYLIRCGCP